MSKGKATVDNVVLGIEPETASFLSQQAVGRFSRNAERGRAAGLPACGSDLDFNSDPSPSETFHGGRTIVSDMSPAIPQMSLPNSAAPGAAVDSGDPEELMETWTRECNGLTLRLGRVDDGLVLVECVSKAERIGVPAQVDGEPIVKIGTRAFAGCKDVRVVALPNTVLELGAFAFIASRVEEVILPSGLRSIGDKAFYHAQNLTRIQLPSTLEEVGEGAFCSCGLEQLSVPASVKRVGRDAFVSKGLVASGESATLRVAPENAHLLLDDQGALYSRDSEGLVLMQLLDPRITFASIAEGTVAIADRAVANHEHLETLVLPEGLKIIGGGSFDSCARLKSVVIPRTLQQLGPLAFHGTCLEAFFIPASLEVMGECALFTGAIGRQKPPTLRSIEIEPGNERFFFEGGVLYERCADGACQALQYIGPNSRVALSHEATVIGPHAFADVDGIDELTLHDGLDGVGICGLAMAKGASRVRIVFQNHPETQPLVARFVDCDGNSNAFRNAFRKGMIDIDLLFQCADSSVVMGTNRFQCAAIMADRLCNPQYLSEAYADLFARNLERNLEATCLEFARHRHLRGFDQLADIGVLSERTIDGVVDALSAHDEVEAVGHLLILKRQRFNAPLFDFDL